MIPTRISYRVNSRIPARYALFLAWLLGAGVQPPAHSEPPRGPVIQLNREKATIDVVELDPADLAKLAQAPRDPSEWQAIFAVHVYKESPTAELPPVLGSYRVDTGGVHFEPRYPLTPGIRYRAIFQVNKIPGREGKAEPMIAMISVPKPVKEPTVVEHVYPSGDRLLENQLRFYIHFSGPMRQGEAYAHLRLLDSFGKALDHPFLELDEELWDPQEKRFTLFFHPGRVKKGLKPREELGPILEAGKSYTLVIDPQWNDADGNPLKEPYRKTFQAVVAQEKSPDPKTWRILPPSAGNRAPLRLRFPGPLDHALLERMLWVVDGHGRNVPGTVAATDHETCWQFTPSVPWQAGNYHIKVDTRLEDPAGNSLRRPFEIDVFHPIERQIQVETIQLPFRIDEG
jgi:hypothetical protein